MTACAPSSMLCNDEIMLQMIAGSKLQQSGQAATEGGLSGGGGGAELESLTSRTLNELPDHRERCPPSSALVQLQAAVSVLHHGHAEEVVCPLGRTPLAN